MRYGNIERAVFLDRPNRFIANCAIGGQRVVCHVKNTGRCRELLTEGAEVWLCRSDKPGRRTGYDLVAVRKGERLVNIDSQAPNRAVGEWLRERRPFGEDMEVYPEKKHGDSRFDFMLKSNKTDRTVFLEVKGCTLERDGAVLFPDAPTERGSKHLRGLMRCIDEGFEAAVMILVQMEDVTYFTPNAGTDPEFAEAMREAQKKGVTVLCFDSAVTPDSIEVGKPVEVRL